jgi:hypothetical protein
MTKRGTGSPSQSLTRIVSFNPSTLKTLDKSSILIFRKRSRGLRRNSSLGDRGKHRLRQHLIIWSLGDDDHVMGPCSQIETQHLDARLGKRLLRGVQPGRTILDRCDSLQRPAAERNISWHAVFSLARHPSRTTPIKSTSPHLSEANRRSTLSYNFASRNSRARDIQYPRCNP